MFDLATLYPTLHTRGMCSYKGDFFSLLFRVISRKSQNPGGCPGVVLLPCDVSEMKKSAFSDTIKSISFVKQIKILQQMLFKNLVD